MLFTKQFFFFAKKKYFCPQLFFSLFIIWWWKLIWDIFRCKLRHLSWDFQQKLIFFIFWSFRSIFIYFSIFGDLEVKLQFHIFMTNKQNEKKVKKWKLQTKEIILDTVTIIISSKTVSIFPFKAVGLLGPKARRNSVTIMVSFKTDLNPTLNSEEVQRAT